MSSREWSNTNGNNYVNGEPGTRFSMGGIKRLIGHVRSGGLEGEIPEVHSFYKLVDFYRKKLKNSKNKKLLAVLNKQGQEIANKIIENVKKGIGYFWSYAHMLNTIEERVKNKLRNSLTNDGKRFTYLPYKNFLYNKFFSNKVQQIIYDKISYKNLKRQAKSHIKYEKIDTLLHNLDTLGVEVHLLDNNDPNYYNQLQRRVTKRIKNAKTDNEKKRITDTVKQLFLLWDKKYENKPNMNYNSKPEPESEYKPITKLNKAFNTLEVNKEKRNNFKTVMEAYKKMSLKYLPNIGNSNKFKEIRSAYKILDLHFNPKKNLMLPNY